MSGRGPQKYSCSKHILHNFDYQGPSVGPAVHGCTSLSFMVDSSSPEIKWSKLPNSSFEFNCSEAEAHEGFLNVIEVF